MIEILLVRNLMMDRHGGAFILLIFRQ